MGQYFYIEAAASASGQPMVLNVAGGAPNPGSTVILWPQVAGVPNALNELWQLTANNYIVSALSPTLVLGLGPGDPPPVIVTTLDGSDSTQRWAVQGYGWSGYVIVNQSNNQVLNIEGGGVPTQNQTIITYPPQTPPAPNDLWQIEPYQSGLALAVVPTSCIYTDRGSGASYNVAMYEPQLGPGQAFLGHIAVNTGGGSYTPTDPWVIDNAPSAIVVAALDDPTVVAPVTGLTPQLLWTNKKGSESGQAGDQSIEIWSYTDTNHPPSYTALGLYAVVGAGFPGTPPTTGSVNNMVAVRNDLVTPGTTGPNVIWNDSHTGAGGGGGQWNSIAYWPVVGGITTMPFVAVNNHASPPSPTTPAPTLLLPAHSSQRPGPPG